MFEKILSPESGQKIVTRKVTANSRQQPTPEMVEVVGSWSKVWGGITIVVGNFGIPSPFQLGWTFDIEILIDGSI